MKKWIGTAAALLALILAGCAQLPQVRYGEMILDTARGYLCLDTQFQCRSLGLITANHQRDRILAVYGQNPWDWKRLDSGQELKELLLEPPQGNYSAEQLEPNLYRLPLNELTRTVWRVLNEEHRERYCDPQEFNC